MNRGLIRQGFKYLEICKKVLERFSIKQMFNGCYGGLAACHTVDPNNAHVFSVTGFLHKNTIDRTFGNAQID